MQGLYLPLRLPGRQAAQPLAEAVASKCGLLLLLLLLLFLFCGGGGSAIVMRKMTTVWGVLGVDNLCVLCPPRHVFV